MIPPYAQTVDERQLTGFSFYPGISSFFTENYGLFSPDFLQIFLLLSGSELCLAAEDPAAQMMKMELWLDLKS